jgi:hypothetical protein
MNPATHAGRPENAFISCCVPGIPILAAAMALFLLLGCAGFESKPIAPLKEAGKTSAADDGIVYYMPLRPIIVQAALDASGVMTITAPSASAIPDRSHPFLLTVPDNAIGESHATIQIGTNGLLQSAATVETSGIDALVKAIATDLGTISGLAGRSVPGPAPTTETCENSRTYARVIWPEKVDAGQPIEPVCGLTVTLVKLGGNSPLSSTSKASEYTNAQSGVFYKTEIPYLVTVKAAAATQGQAFIAYSPDEAPILFVPLKKSFFANNTTTFTLTDGLLTKSDSDVGGEITGLALLPADAIAAYMTALGNIFSSLKTNATDKTGLAVSNALLQACRAAIAANPIQGVSAAQAATNYVVIKAACGG